MLRVAVYARVSTDKDDQLNSLANQCGYFESYIKNCTDWSYAGVYYDEGITGTQTKKRAGFNSLISDCREGKIDLILTKEVSRFARNTVDTLKYTRILKEYNVGVLFINDNIDTRDNDGEFRLAIMASVAQEESRKTSERVKWGQRRAMENGVVFGNNSLLGYDVKNGALTVNEDEAEIVRHIFNKYVNEGKGTHIIARELTEENIRPPKTRKNGWSSSMVLRVLRNEKYVGDLLQKKYITKDYLTHKKIINEGEKIFIPNHHTAIIDRATWEKAQKRLTEGNSGVKYSSRYWCSGKIVCGECGAKFTPRRSNKKSGVYVSWGCRTGKGGCHNSRMRSDKSLLSCMRFVTERLFEELGNIADEIPLCLDNQTDAYKRLRERINELEEKKLRMLDSFLSSQLREDEMIRLRERYDNELSELRERLARNTPKTYSADEIRQLIKNDSLYSESVYGEILEKITSYDNYIVIKLKHLDNVFKIRYSTYGYKENYTTVIEQCDIEEI